MSQVFACEFPDDFWFDVAQDVWIEVRPEGHLRVGMTDPAQTRAGKVLHVRAKTGKTLKAGKNVASIESAKWVGPFPAPFDGTVIAVNSAVLDGPNLINRDPYGKGWIAELVSLDPDWQKSVTLGKNVGEVYRAKLQEEGLTCMRCAPLPEDVSDASQ
jgi:glycine cleavage system H protein